MLSIYNKLHKESGRKHSSFEDVASVYKVLKESHVVCFDCAQIAQLTDDLAHVYMDEIIAAVHEKAGGYVDRLRLPAEYIWLENAYAIKSPEDVYQSAILIGDDQPFTGGYIPFKVYLASKYKTHQLDPSWFTSANDFMPSMRLCRELQMSSSEVADFYNYVMRVVFTTIWVLNTPKHIRCTEVPARKRSKRRASKFPVRSYKTVNLIVNEEIVDVNIPGTSDAVRPYHYVRGHMKPSIDQYIEGYFRGNKEAGEIIHDYNCTTKPEHV